MQFACQIELISLANPRDISPPHNTVSVLPCSRICKAKVTSSAVDQYAPSADNGALGTLSGGPADVTSERAFTERSRRRSPYRETEGSGESCVWPGSDTSSALSETDPTHRIKGQRAAAPLSHHRHDDALQLSRACIFTHLHSFLVWMLF